MKKVEEFQKESKSSFKTRDCLNKERGEKLKMAEILKDGIEYHFLKFVCKHGGRNHQKSRSSGQREAK